MAPCDRHAGADNGAKQNFIEALVKKSQRSAQSITDPYICPPGSLVQVGEPGGQPGPRGGAQHCDAAACIQLH
jgi:hypothetical protein